MDWNATTLDGMVTGLYWNVPPRLEWNGHCSVLKKCNHLSCNGDCYGLELYPPQVVMGHRFGVECELPPVGMVCYGLECNRLSWNGDCYGLECNRLSWNGDYYGLECARRRWNSHLRPYYAFSRDGNSFLFFSAKLFPECKATFVVANPRFLAPSLSLLSCLLLFFASLSLFFWCFHLLLFLPLACGALFRSRNLRTIIRGLPAERRRRSRTWAVSGDPLDRGRLWVAWSSRKPILFVAVCFVQDESRIVSLSLSLSLVSFSSFLSAMCAILSWLKCRDSGVGFGMWGDVSISYDWIWFRWSFFFWRRKSVLVSVWEMGDSFIIWM